LHKSVAALAAVLLSAAAITAQAPDRIATTADALIASPVFFHGKRIVVRHAVRQTDRLSELDATAKPVYVFWRERPSASEGEIRGEFWDLGRMTEGDERFASYDFRPVIEAANGGRWPARDQVFVILNATFVPGPPPTTPSIRSIALTPEQFDNRTVTVVGRFKGRNLFGDLPQGVGKSKWDFVLQSADGAIWVTGLRPKGKDFDLDPGARVDTGRWLEVTGTVHRDAAALWIAGESLHVTAAPTDMPVEVAAPPTPVEPPPTVIFSAPLGDETDFPVGGRVRIQFSRDMKGATFQNRVHVRYTGPNAPPTPPPPSTATYNDGTRALEITFKAPLERFQTVTIELQDGITAIDGQPLKPWTLRFSTGG
jgi:Big-like domain-containing protein